MKALAPWVAGQALHDCPPCARSTQGPMLGTVCLRSPGHHMGGAGAHFTKEAPQLWVAGREFAQEGNGPWPPVLLDSSSRCYPPPCRELARGVGTTG